MMYIFSWKKVAYRVQESIDENYIVVQRNFSALQ